MIYVVLHRAHYVHAYQEPGREDRPGEFAKIRHDLDHLDILDIVDILDNLDDLF